jgi:hypothetical protein
MADALRTLADEIASNAPIRALAAPAPDLDEWSAPIATRAGGRWLETDWFFAETYAYRRAIEAVRFWELAIDPFRATKEEELARAATWGRVRDALAIGGGDAEDRIAQLLFAALWSNRMDLSYAASRAHGTTAAERDLLVDDRAAAFAAMRLRDDVHLIADNAGTELLVDLVLCDALVSQGKRVVIHVKAHPTFVSDAIAIDVHDAIALFRARDGEIGALGLRLDDAIATGRFAIAPDAYWNSPRFIDDRPARIDRALASGGLAIVKGDANYRRIVGDADWDPATAPRDASGELPCAMLALRTLKSDPIVGLPKGLAGTLDAEDPAWRTNGKRGVAQVFPG